MEPNISILAALIADTARSRMLLALMGGQALTATELALEANITAQTASSHLHKLLEGGILVVRKQGRHKYFQIKHHEIAELIEKLLQLTPQTKTSSVFTGPQDQALRVSRVCYDHLAGELGVKLYDSLVREGLIIDNYELTHLTEDGLKFFQKLGLNLDLLKKSKRPICKSCLDWSERRNHMAGALGQWILEDIFNKGWAVKERDSRVITFSEKSKKLFYKQYYINS